VTAGHRHYFRAANELVKQTAFPVATLPVHVVMGMMSLATRPRHQKSLIASQQLPTLLPIK